MRLLVRGHPRSGTTLLAKMLNDLDNSLILYESGLYDISFDAWIDSRRKMKYILKRLNKIKNNNIFFDFKNIKKKIENTENYLNAIDTMNKMEGILFNSNYNIYGDKLPRWNNKLIDRLIQSNIDFKIIHIHRDGRDAVTSRYRQFNRKQDAPWTSLNVYQSSLEWANYMRNYLKYKKSKLDILELRLSDFKHQKNETIIKLSEFLEIERIKIETVVNNNFVENKANFKSYKSTISNWKKEFSEKGIKMLRELDYISE